SQVVPGPNMMLMMSFVGLKVGGLPGAIASALATFGPPCLMYYTSYRLWDRFRDRPWQQTVRRGLASLTIGLVIAGGYVMARTADVGWRSAMVTAAAVGLMLGTRLSPLWILMSGGVLAASASSRQGSDRDRIEIGCPVGRGPEPHHTLQQLSV